MKKWIRWQGLGAFVGIMVLLSGLWLLFIDNFVKRMIEKTGTHLIGAKVELDDADVSLFPAGLIISRLQVTNPDEPMTNAVEIARIGFSMDSLNALRRKVIIEEMTMEGVRFGTPRRTSGALAGREEEKPSAVKKEEAGKVDTVRLPLLKMPDVKDILQKEELTSVKLLESLRSDVKAEKRNWEQQLKDLPDEGKIADYKRRIKELKSAKKGGLEGVLDGIAKAKAIRKDLESDLDRIKAARKEFSAAQASLRKRLDQVERAPAEDVQRLKNKYSLSPQGLANLSRMLMGPKISEWVQKALMWYEKIQPALRRSGDEKANTQGPAVVKPIRAHGVDVRFKEYFPLPDFLIRRAKASVQLPAGDLAGSIKNITPDQDILGAPLMFLFSGDKLSGVDSVKLDGTLNHVVPNRSSNTVNLRVQGYEARNLSLVDDAELAITMENGLADLGLNATLSGEVLSATVSAGLKSTRLLVETPDGENSVARAMGSALSNVSEFSLTADIAGTLDKYDIHVRSDLDRVLRDAVGTVIQKERARMERKLMSAIAEKVNTQLAELKNSINDLDSINNELTRRLTLGG